MRLSACSTVEQKMQYAASLLPDVFTKGTRYESLGRSNMRVAYKME